MRIAQRAPTAPWPQRRRPRWFRRAVEGLGALLCIGASACGGGDGDGGAARIELPIDGDRPAAAWSAAERAEVCAEVDAYLARDPAVERLTCTLLGLRAGPEACEQTQRSCIDGAGADYRAQCFNRLDSGWDLSGCAARAADVAACAEGTADLARGLILSCNSDPQDLRDLAAPACARVDFDACGFSPLEPP